MGLHPWWFSLGHEVEIDDLASPPAEALAAALKEALIPGATLIAIGQTADRSIAAVRMEIDVERPQDLAYPIMAVEPIVAAFSVPHGCPSALAIRDDFPDTPHQNWVPEGYPCSLCVDDRPWAEARLTWSPPGFVRQIQEWLAKASRGELHETGRPVEPLFFGAPYSLIVPRQILEQDPNKLIELIGYQPADGQGSIIISELSNAAEGLTQTPGRFTVLRLRAARQPMSGLRRAPETLAALSDAVRPLGLDLLEQLHARLLEWAGLEGDGLRRLSSNLAIIVAFPIEVPEREDTIDDLRAFIVPMPAGEVGVMLGWLHRNNSGVGGNQGHLRVIGGGNCVKAPEIKLLATNIHLAFDRELAAVIAGRQAADYRRAVLIGAGSIGSQLAMNLAREGFFRWSVIDDDRLMPHNLARHELPAGYVGASKAYALANEISSLLREPCPAVITNILFPDDAEKPALNTRLAEADFIIDTSASVAVSRHLSHLGDAPGRRIAAFFNPGGTACVLLVEALDRSVTLHDLEAQYHRLIQSEPQVENHLTTTQGALRYSGSCRAATNRIPATRAALLSALAARGLTAAVDAPEPTIQIWTLTLEGGVELLRRTGEAVTRRNTGDWQLAYDDGLLAKLSWLREVCLPNETGGVLLGLVDRERRTLHLVDALPQPADSVSSVSGFERGVDGLLPAVNHAAEKSMHQIQYVGEWHSHPQRSSAAPSVTDLTQVVWLGEQMEGEGLPVVMAIAADNGAYTFVTINPSVA
jgi:hypothetical protein